MNDEVLEIQKRVTLNWLIQGAAQHAGMTFHHLMRDELNVLEPELLRLYDHFALIGLLQYWNGMAVLVYGWPPRFWRRAASKPSHPFFGHPLLPKYGGILAEAARQRARERCKEKGLVCFPVLFSVQALRLVGRLRRLETPHRRRLIQLARKATSTVWGIPVERLGGELADRIVLGDIIPLRTSRDQVLQNCITGYGGVVRGDEALRVTAKAINWQVLAAELVKGTAELICLHGLNQLSDETYRRVMDATESLELESWMLQSGGELWRRLMALLPDDRPVASMLMHLARLPPNALESLITAVIEQPELAQRQLAGLADGATT